MQRWILLAALTGLLAGGAAALTGHRGVADAAWAATTLAALVPLTIAVLRALAAGHAGVDVIALLAMVGSLVLGQYLAGAVIALMLSGGQALEDFAGARARRELRALVDRSPRVVHRYEDGTLTGPSLEDVRPGDRLLVKPGEVVPVDGVVVGDVAMLDESALTGEAAAVERREGEQVRSGTVNAATAPFDMHAIATADASTYAAIVRLVQQAQASKAPLVRLADRYALVFLPLTLLAAALAWLVSGEPVRALAVLVVATPCPLILAAPIAIVSGISRAARRGIIVKGGAALEALGRGRILVLDKTGTLTGGAPLLTEVEPFGDSAPDELLRLGASLELMSAHVLAAPIVRAARSRGLRLVFPTEVSEQLGAGIAGQVEGRSVVLGRAEWVAERCRTDAAELRRLRRRSLLDGSSSVIVAIDGTARGALILEDAVRGDAQHTLRALRRAGFERILMLTGDHVDLAETVGAAVGVDRVYAERSPADKLEVVRAVSAEGVTVMVGDGINDAAALAAADVGVAMGARGATAASEAADAVLVVDRLDRLAEAVRIARRSRGVALQSVWAGMGLSVAGMGLAAAGLLSPVAGALVQEAIDVAVILNALRARREGSTARVPNAAVDGIGRQYRQEHRELWPQVKRIRQVADRLDTLSPARARDELQQLHRFLEERLLPHERHEDAEVYPVVAQLIGGDDPTATMSRAHLEIAHLVRVFGRLLLDLPPDRLDPEDLQELRRVLYGLYAVLRLHFAQEEESYLALMETQAGVDA
ncbi:MAG TPA: heavy metal translocating P-type ATPase [Candidatus Polarisedimenticolaceae bacterium]|nr:heavy metal translocating P-type ATPase [Candidatus Polarisedimenticolaceae bacterium]